MGNKAILTNNVRYLLLTIAFLLAVALPLVLGYHFFITSTEESPERYSFGINDHGHTYMNSGYFCPFLCTEYWPDLLRVIATNDEVGYVFTDEMVEAEGVFMADNEAWERQASRPRIIAAAFSDLLESELGAIISDLSDDCRLDMVVAAKAMQGLTFDFVFTGGASSFEYSECGEEIAYFMKQAEIEMIFKLEPLGIADSGFADLLENALTCEESMTALREVISRLYFEAEQAAITFLPVYGPDAKTVIGEFPILLPPKR